MLTTVRALVRFTAGYDIRSSGRNPDRHRREHGRAQHKRNKANQEFMLTTVGAFRRNNGKKRSWPGHAF
jgi:hypothetical protein